MILQRIVIVKRKGGVRGAKDDKIFRKRAWAAVSKVTEKSRRIRMA